MNGTAMFVHNFRDDGKSQADAGFFRGDEGIENLLAHFGWNARTRVFNARFDAGAAAGVRGGERDAQRAAHIAHGFVGVLNQIDERAIGQIFVERNIRQARREAAFNAHGGAAPGFRNRGKRAIDERRERRRVAFGAQRPREIEKARYERADAIDFA